MHRHFHRMREAHAAREFGFHGRAARHGLAGRMGRRAARVFDQGDLRFVILKLISEQPRHGYEIIKAIEEKVGGAYSPSPGVSYPTLTLLEELGYVRPAPDGAGGTKKLYEITDEGHAFLAANRPLVDSILGRMAELSAAYGGGPAPEIVRAMENLRQALAIRLGRGPLGADQVRAITAVLDRAAGEVERS